MIFYHAMTRRDAGGRASGRTLVHCGPGPQPRKTGVALFELQQFPCLYHLVMKRLSYGHGKAFRSVPGEKVFSFFVPENH